jgi:hypothetical protein
LRLIKPLPKDHARVHPFAGNGDSWRSESFFVDKILLAATFDLACRFD